MPSDVFTEHDAGLSLANDASDLGPKVSRIFLPSAATGETERLTRVSRSDAIHDSTPRAAVEGSEVAPDRCRIHGFVFHARRQDRGGESFPFDVTDDASRSACCEVNSEVEAADAGAEGEDVEGVTIHKRLTPETPAAR